MTCPHHAAVIAEARRHLPHLDEGDVKRMERDLSSQCPECARVTKESHAD